MNYKISIWMLVLITIAAAVCAAPANPEYYWGYVYIENNLAQNNTTLLCKTALGELLYNSTLPYAAEGSYFAEIKFDKPQTPADEGANLNESIIWYVDGIQAVMPATDRAESGKNNNNFTIRGFRNPNVTVSTDYDSSYFLGDDFNLTVDLNNTGGGRANTLVEFENNSEHIAVMNNSHESESFTDSLNRCGSFNNSLDVSVKNYANATVQTYSEDIAYDVVGPDLKIQMSVSDTTPNRGQNVTIKLNITNIGGQNVSGYNLTLKAGSVVLITTEYVNELEPNTTRNMTYFWSAQTGAENITASLSTSTSQCISANDNVSVSITVAGGGSSGGGSHVTGGSIFTFNYNRTIPMSFEIAAFPKLFEDLIPKDSLLFEVENEWYTIFIEDVLTNKAGATMSWDNVYYSFNKGDEQVLQIKNYDLYIRLEQIESGKATFTLDLIKRPELGVQLGILDKFKLGSNATFTLNITNEIDVVVEEALYLMNKLVFNKTFTVTEPGIIKENLGSLGEGVYYLFLTLHSGKQIKELNAGFTVGNQQLPMIVSKIAGQFDIKDFIILTLIALSLVSVILGFMLARGKRDDYEDEEEDEDMEQQQSENYAKKEDNMNTAAEGEKKRGRIRGIFASVRSVFSRPKKQQEVQAEEGMIEDEPQQIAEPKKGIDFAGKKETIYMQYENLRQLKSWLQEYHKEQHITVKMKAMPLIVQKIGPEVYANPRQVTRDDVVRISRMFSEKHDYITYNDLLIAGSVVVQELKRTLNSGIVEQKQNKSTAGKVAIRCHAIKGIAEVEGLINSLRQGVILFIDTSQMPRAETDNLKRMIARIKKTCDVLGGEIAITADKCLIVTPNSQVGILRSK
jgi:SepF-like predicted cell division protein (DUF552 family)